MTDQTPSTEEVPLGMAMYAKWGFEKWQKQMYTEVAVAYRLMSLGIVNGDEDYTPEDMAEVDAEYRIWLAAHDRETAAKARADVLRKVATEIEQQSATEGYRTRPSEGLYAATRALDTAARNIRYRIGAGDE